MSSSSRRPQAGLRTVVLALFVACAPAQGAFQVFLSTDAPEPVARDFVVRLDFAADIGSGPRSGFDPVADLRLSALSLASVRAFTSRVWLLTLRPDPDFEGVGVVRLPSGALSDLLNPSSSNRGASLSVSVDTRHPVLTFRVERPRSNAGAGTLRVVVHFSEPVTLMPGVPVHALRSAIKVFAGTISSVRVASPTRWLVDTVPDRIDARGMRLVVPFALAIDRAGNPSMLGEFHPGGS